MSNFDALRAMAVNDTGHRGSVDFIVSNLTSFMAAGLRNASHDVAAAVGHDGT